MADFELLLEKYQNKSLGKGLFIESIIANSQNAFKRPEKMHCKLVLTKVNLGSKLV